MPIVLLFENGRLKIAGELEKEVLLGEGGSGGILERWACMAWMRGGLEAHQAEPFLQRSENVLTQYAP